NKTAGAPLLPIPLLQEGQSPVELVWSDGAVRRLVSDVALWAHCLLQLPHQPVVPLRRRRGLDPALVAPGGEGGPEQAVGAEDGDEQGPAGEIQEIADDMPGAVERLLRVKPNETQAEDFPGRGVDDQAGRRPDHQEPGEGLDTPDGPQLGGGGDRAGVD